MGGRQYTRRMDFAEGLAELHTHLGGSVASEIMWSLAHEQGIALPVKDFWEFDRLVTVSDPRGAEPRRAERDLPAGPDPVEPARGRALRARGDRRRVSLAGDHDARDPLQPHEAEPRRRARPRPHHPRRHPRPRPRRARVPAGAGRPDPHDGPDVRPPPERGDRREGARLGIARHRRHRHRRAAPRRALPVPRAMSRSSTKRARRGSA